MSCKFCITDYKCSALLNKKNFCWDCCTAYTTTGDVFYFGRVGTTHRIYPDEKTNRSMIIWQVSKYNILLDGVYDGYPKNPNEIDSYLERICKTLVLK